MHAPSPRTPTVLALAFAGALTGAAPTVLTGDSAEIQSVALLGGIPHPTGYPTAMLAGCFLAGLTPYLWLVWAHTQSYAMDYLRYTEIGFFPAGPVPPYFDSAGKGVWWLVTARNHLPPVSPAFVPRAFARGVLGSALQLGLELGPIGVPFALVGLRRQLREHGGLGPLFVAMAGLSIAFTAMLASGWMTSVFLIPATLVLCLWAAFGMDALIRWLAARGATAALAGASPTILPMASSRRCAGTASHGAMGKRCSPRCPRVLWSSADGPSS